MRIKNGCNLVCMMYDLLRIRWRASIDKQRFIHVVLPIKVTEDTFFLQEQLTGKRL